MVRRLSSSAGADDGWRSPRQSAPGPVVTKSARSAGPGTAAAPHPDQPAAGGNAPPTARGWSRPDVRALAARVTGSAASASGSVKPTARRRSLPLGRGAAPDQACASSGCRGAGHRPRPGISAVTLSSAGIGDDLDLVPRRPRVGPVDDRRRRPRPASPWPAPGARSARATPPLRQHLLAEVGAEPSLAAARRSAACSSPIGTSGAPMTSRPTSGRSAERGQLGQRARGHDDHRLVVGEDPRRRDQAACRERGHVLGVGGREQIGARALLDLQRAAPGCRPG